MSDFLKGLRLAETNDKIEKTNLCESKPQEATAYKANDRRDEKAKSPQACWNFEEGDCRNGDKCRFSTTQKKRESQKKESPVILVPMNGLQTEIIREMECVLTSKKENADEERNVSLNIQMKAKKRQKSVLILKKENVIVGTIASLVMTQIRTHHGAQS